MSEIFKTISNESTGEYKDRGSKFIAHCFPVNTAEDALSKLSFVKKEHPKARHHCYAYRLGTDKTIFRTNDDGEPSGTAGKPILGQIDSFGITNVVVVVVRYFGGTLLGTGGLINAYRESAKNSLSAADIISQKKHYASTIHCSYSLLPQVMNLLKKMKVKIIESDIDVDCQLKICADKEQLKMLNETSGIKIES